MKDDKTASCMEAALLGASMRTQILEDYKKLMADQPEEGAKETSEACAERHRKAKTILSHYFDLLKLEKQSVQDSKFSQNEDVSALLVRAAAEAKRLEDKGFYKTIGKESLPH